MGAFGELLITYWGGDINSYRGNGNNNSSLPIETEEEIRQRRIEFGKQRKLSLARQHLNRLTTNIMYQRDIVNQINETLFKDSYKDIGFSLEISNVMWDEYQQFISKYINKQ